MALPAGTRLGPYQILGPIGAGATGEVYRANDTRLDRVVAIKILPAHLADDPEVRQRFEQEARAASRLSHPHICALYDVGHEEGIDFLVMEYLEGETLSARLAAGALPAGQVLRYGIQIAEALDEAHRHGLTHRDLKPGNIMLTSSGVKLLDFGLAKARRAASGAETSISVPSGSLTAGGTIVGTVPYMSPEQLNGKDADARSDIFALGAVLYEMATGRRAFRGETQASVIGAILHKDPAPMAPGRPGRAGPWSAAMPPLRRLVNRCLAKDPGRRWQSARDVMLELEAISLGEGSRPRISLTWLPRASALGWILAAIFAVASLALGIAWRRRAPAETTAVRFSIPPPENATLLPGAAISPDGRRLVFRANGSDGQILLWLRPLDSVNPQPLPETNGGVNPFWSPDGRFIAFWAQGKLKRIGAEAPFGRPETICSAPAVASGAWSPNGVIIFSTGSGGGLSRVPAEGGAPSPLTTLDAHENAHLWPQFLPDGRHFLYFSRSKDRDDEGVYASSLDSPASRSRLVGTDVAAAFAPPQRGSKSLLLFLRGGSLMAQPFDAGALQLSGEPFLVAERVDQTVLAGFAFFTVSNNGVLAYRSGGGVDSQLVWFDRAGKQLGTVGAPGRYRNPRLSPDGRQVAVERIDPSNGVADIWVLDLLRGTVLRLTYRPVADMTPVWSPDSARIVFASERDGPRSLFQKDASGAGKEELLLKTPLRLVGALDWSSDGRFILYDTTSGETRRDLWALPLFGNRKPLGLLHEAFGEYQGQFSPDGRQIAYASDESSALEVYVQNLPSPSSAISSGGKLRVSTGGGSEPQWRRDGKELFYLAPDHKLMAVEVKPGPKLQLGAPRPLFDTHIRFTSVTRNHYTVSADGQRFLVNLSLEDTASSPITVVVNWASGHKQ